MAANDQALEDLMGTLGEFGRYQLFQFSLQVMAGYCAAVHMLSMVTVCATPNHRCKLDGDSNDYNNEGDMEKLPKLENGDGDNCHMYDESNNTVECEEYVYDTEYYKSSRSIEWNQVCDKRWMNAVAQSAYMLGVFFGAVLCGTLADKFGRRTIYRISVIGMLIAGVGVAFIDDYILFLCVRLIYGFFGSAGCYVTGFVLTMELVGQSKRTVCGVFYQVMFSFGIMAVAIYGAFIEDRKWLQVTYGLQSLFLLIPFIFLHESPRWLWSKGRVGEAVDIVSKGLRCNKSDIVLDRDSIVAKKAQGEKGENPSVGFLDLFKTPRIRSKTFNVCTCWFANSLVYYSLSFNVGILKGNPFLILFLLGLVEIPSYLFTMCLLDKWGRRIFTSMPMILGGACCIIAGFIPSTSVFITFTAMIGKLFIASSFAVIYIYTAELFPTVIRNSAIGVSAMSARCSGALTPLISLLDSLDKIVPPVIFGLFSIISGSLILLLPETVNQKLPETIEDGENFGEGDTCCASCFGKKS